MKLSSIFILPILFLTFRGTAQIPNSDFEFWEPDSIFERPVGWTTNNGEFLSFGVTKDTNSYSGNYAIRVASGNKNIHAAQTNFAIDFHPKILNAYVKTSRNPSDSTKIEVYLFNQGVLVDSGDTNIKVNNNDYFFLVSLPLSINASASDSAIIRLSASDPDWWLDACYLWVDHLWFDDQVGLQNISPGNDVRVFPNPVKDMLNISFSKKPESLSHITLTDATGVKYLETVLFQQENKINIASLRSGIYFLTIKHEEVITVKKILKL
ncbi:MAG: T9SS type A sorting domain-containing protein [Chitinophagales bacterium]|nr:T9SS type A sorting domain-containing protein [Chitinophagales bacterium]